MTGKEPLLAIKNLRKSFPVRLGAFGRTRATVYAVADLTFEIFKGETLSLVGESGCGKSTAGQTILQLYRPTAGSVVYKGQNLVRVSDRDMRPIRRRLQIVFQDPYSTLDPRMTVGEVIAEPIRHYKLRSGPELHRRVEELLSDVGLTASFAKRYPHELSGGQRQRVVIARALACEPEFLLCDEAISALDVSVQAQIINLLQDLQDKYNLTYLFIAHDLAVVRHVSDRVAVMYLGKFAELGPRDQVFERPLHPYTVALMSAVPEANPARERERKRYVLEGDVPSPINPPSGCFFHTRCPKAQPVCKIEAPEWREARAGQWVACHFAAT